MRLTRLRLLLPVLAVAAMGGALSACGSSGGGTTSSVSAGIPAEFQAPTAAPDNAKKGGTLTVLSAGDIDHMDPGAAYYQFTYMMDFGIVRPLLSWPPNDTAQPKPDLAATAPTISSDGKTITFHLRSGVKFGPPVNRDVTSADVKYAIERGLLPGVANGYESSYLGSLVGFSQAEAAVKKNTTVAPNISGITTPDSHTIVFKLTDTSSAPVIQALSLPLSAPVPESYAKKFDAQTPSTYQNYVVSSGPYMVQNDCNVKVDSTTHVAKATNPNCTGKLTGYTPGKEIDLVRNPNWNPSTDFRPAYLDSITFQEGFTDPTSAGQKILGGSSEVTGDFSLAKTTVQQVASGSKYSKTQMSASPAGGNYYVALNTTKPPFNNINVRKAVIAGTNRTALRNQLGGALFGPVATHFIPPGIPGFDEAGGLAGPNLDFIKNPNGNAALAASYMKKAGYSSGKCSGANCSITMVADNGPPLGDVATVVKNELEGLGFKVTLRPVTHDTMYTRFCDVPKAEPNVCPSVGWIKDFNDPQSMLQVPFNGEAISSTNNSNWPLLNDKAINKAIDNAVTVSNPTQRAQTWGHIDDMIMAQAPAIPWSWTNEVYGSSSNVATVINLFNAEPDISFSSIK